MTIDLAVVALAFLSLAVQWGSMRTAGKAIDRRLDAIDESIKRFGERLGSVESDVRVLQSQMARVERHLDGDYSGVVKR